MDIPFFRQRNAYSCGPASLQMVFDYFGYHVSQERLVLEMRTNKDDGTDHSDLIRAAVKNGFYCYVNGESSLEEIGYFLRRNFPVIVNFIEPSGNDPHYAVVTRIAGRYIFLNDPWNGKGFCMKASDFKLRWFDKENRSFRWMMVLSERDLCLGKQFRPKNY